jgi:hypothetical protein
VPVLTAIVKVRDITAHFAVAQRSYLCKQHIVRIQVGNVTLLSGAMGALAAAWVGRERGPALRGRVHAKQQMV